MAATVTPTEQEKRMETISSPMDYRESQWKVVERKGTEGSLEFHLHTMQRGKWRNKHRVLAVVNKSKPLFCVQLRTSNGSFLLAVENAVLEGMTVELRTALDLYKEIKKKRMSFCSKYF